jgi:hypothetical protein
VSWLDLVHDPERLQIILAEVGTTPHDFALDVYDVPEYRERCKLLPQSTWLRLALEVFGDQHRKQPPRHERTAWHIYGYTRDWDSLPPLPGAESTASPAAAKGPGRYGKEYEGKAVVAAVLRAYGREPTRALRDELAELDGVSTHAATLILDALAADKLVSDGAQVWQKKNGELSAVPVWVNLHELLTGS